MLIETLAPLTLRLPGGNERRLIAGQFVDLPDEQATKLLERAPGKVRRATPDWLGAWRELADCTLGITHDDPRFQPIMSALDECDRAFTNDDWPGFQRAADRVRMIATARVAKEQTQ